MRSIIYPNGRTTIPAAIRKKFNLKAKTKIDWIELDGGAIMVIPVPEDPIKAFMGMGNGKGSVQEFLDERRKDREREEEEYQRYFKKK